MKIRNGFVSNSSSSSFVLLGKQINFDDVEQHINNGEKVIFTVEGWEGQVLELLSYVKAFREVRKNSTYSGDPIYQVYLAYHFALIGDECDQFSVHSVSDMEEFLDEELEKVQEKVLEYSNPQIGYKNEGTV